MFLAAISDNDYFQRLGDYTASLRKYQKRHVETVGNAIFGDKFSKPENSSNSDGTFYLPSAKIRYFVDTVLLFKYSRKTWPSASLLILGYSSFIAMLSGINPYVQKID